MLWSFSVLSLPAVASPWIQLPGQVRASAGYQQLVTDREFASPEAAGRVGPGCPGGVLAGQRAPYDCTTGGRFRNQSIFLDVSAGVVEGLAVDLAVPIVVAARFEDELGRTDARGLGDLRAGLRVGKKWGAWAVAGALHAKAPTGPAGLVDRDVPLGDAQWDVLPGVRVGLSLDRYGWVETHQQLVVRLKSARSGVNPGEEWTGSLGGGLNVVEWGGIQARAEWILAAQDTDSFGLPHPGRSLIQVRGGPFVRSGRFWSEVGVAVPLAGRRWPAAAVWGGALSWTFGPT